MSDKKQKQVIHVKDLVIKADHVYIERGKPHRPHNEFGHRPEKRRNGESSDERHHHESESREHERERRGPFDWL